MVKMKKKSFVGICAHNVTVGQMLLSLRFRMIFQACNFSNILLKNSNSLVLNVFLCKSETLKMKSVSVFVFGLQ